MAKLENLFASRFLKARKSNRLLSFLSVTSVVGVMLGVATLITVISVMDGFTDNLKAKFLGSNPHIVINHLNLSPIENWEEKLDEVAAVKNVVTVTPLIMGQAMISNERNVTGIIVRGLDPDREMTNGGLMDTMVSGSLRDLKTREGEIPKILVGSELIYSLGAIMGREITVISPTVSRGAFGITPKMRKYRVAGYFDTGMYEHNKTLVYMDLKEAQDFFMLDDGISAITVNVTDPDKAAEVAFDIQTLLNATLDPNRDMPVYFSARDWLSMNTTLFEALKLEQYALFVILTLIIIVASFTIVSMITVTVKDKRKDIAIIRAMGGSEKLIKNIFVRQGLIIGAVGTLLGNLIALILGLILKNFKIIEVSKEIYFSDTIPIKLSLSTFIVVTLCALTITFVASLLPARMSAKMAPIDAIRND